MSQEIEFKKKPIVIAVDFDGVLCEDCYPKIGKADDRLINEFIERRKEGDKLILWTCRRGIYLNNAIAWCRKRGLEFDAINENLPEYIEKYRGDTRKVFADIYVDDRNDYTCYLDKTNDFGNPLLEDYYDDVDYAFKKEGFERVYSDSTTFSYEKYDEKHNYIHCIAINIKDDGIYTIQSYQKSKKNSMFVYSVKLSKIENELIQRRINKLSHLNMVTGNSTNRVICVDIHSGRRYYNKFVHEKIIDVVYPTTMPNTPTKLPFKVYTEDYLYNRKNGDFDTKAILYIIKPDGTKIDVNNYYKQKGGTFKKISKFEYLLRRTWGSHICRIS